MYITTSKNPSPLSVKFAKRLALLLFSVYENRGKKAIEKVVARAKLHGMRRALFVYEKNKMPHSLVFMQLNGEWKWLKPEIAVKEFKFYRLPKYFGDGIVLSKKTAPKFRKLFDFSPIDSDDVSELAITKTKIYFLYRKKKIGMEILRE
ncbi:MAG: hypothetical protein QXP42_04870 [Candidatus Micrarchaeia archaeon]